MKVQAAGKTCETNSFLPLLHRHLQERKDERTGVEGGGEGGRRDPPTPHPPTTTTMQENRYEWQKWWRQASKSEITANRPARLPPITAEDESIVEREERSGDGGRMVVNDGGVKERKKRRVEGNTENDKKSEKKPERSGPSGLMQKRKEGDFLDSESNVTETNRKRKVAVAFGNSSGGSVENEPNENDDHNAKRGGHPPRAS